MACKIVGYCMKCKTKREMEDAKKTVMKNKREAAKGVCGKCGTKMFKILSDKDKACF